MIPLPAKVKSKGNYKIHIEFSDGTKGSLDISHLAHKGVFKAWDKGNLFDKVYINPGTNAICWNEELELCSDSLYLKLRQMTYEDWKSQNPVHASN